MMSVALTGNVASGKTLVAELWRRAGIPVVLADDLARDVVRPGSEGLDAVVQAFGRGVLADDGSLDRTAVRKLVFSSLEKRERLEAILHPLIRASRELWVEEQRFAGSALVVAEIPLLFEVGMEEDFDVVVLVEAPEGERLRRLMEDRGLPEETARGIMEAQMPNLEKRARADFILDNSGTREELEERALALLDMLRARSRGAGGGMG